MLKTPDEWLIYGTMMFVMSIVSLVAEHQCPSDAWERLCWAAPGSACLSMQQRASRMMRSLANTATLSMLSKN
jgi:hypothetical protein